MTRAALVGRHVSVVAALVSGTACTPAPAPTPSCDDLGVVIVAAGPAERRVLGSGVPYDADPMLGARTDELASSQRARRAAAWAAVARVLAPWRSPRPPPSTLRACRRSAPGTTART
ncbi:MAG: hypothetical protein U0353_28330 [Sandaracinus sp.]